jgi:hypothetical protein
MVIKTAISTKKSRTLQGKDKNFHPKENSLLENLRLVVKKLIFLAIQPHPTIFFY